MIKCNVSVCGTVSKAAVVRNGKDGMPFTTYSVDVVVPAKKGINKTVIVSCIMDGDDAEGIVVGNRIELKGVLTFKKKDGKSLLSFGLDIHRPTLVVILHHLYAVEAHLLALAHGITHVYLGYVFQLPVLQSCHSDVLSCKIAVIRMVAQSAIGIVELDRLKTFLL